MKEQNTGFGEYLSKFAMSNRYTALLYKGLSSLHSLGLRATLDKLRGRLRGARFLQRHKFHLYSSEELQRQRSVAFSREIKFSILVPLYNTREDYLIDMIRSVQAQTYCNWELCLADGSDEAHEYVRRICEELAQADDRIVYRKLDRNMGISGNTNVCFDLASGDYMALLDHDDMLSPAALYECMEVICSQDADFIYTDEIKIYKGIEDAFEPHFKPDFAPDTLRGVNYICHLAVFQAALIEKVGKFRTECDGSQDYDLILRLTEQARKIVHIPRLLYFWRCHPDSVAGHAGAKPYVIEAAHRALTDHLSRTGLNGRVLDSAVPTMYRIAYDLEGTPLVSILIPGFGNPETIRRCLDSIYEKSTYRNFEVVLVHSSEATVLSRYINRFQAKWDTLKVIQWDNQINYSAVYNYAASHASGEHLLLLDSHAEVISPDWIEQLLMYSQRSDVGAAGAMLYYPDDTVAHAGLGIGLMGGIGHLHRNFHRNHRGYMGRLSYAQNLSGVSGSCAMIRRDVWNQIGGLDEAFPKHCFDADLCIRLRQAGYLILWTPFAELYCHRSKKQHEGQTREVQQLMTHWQPVLAAGDPYYSPNFDQSLEDFSYLV